MSAPLGKVAGGMIVPVNDFEAAIQRLERITDNTAAGEVSPNALIQSLRNVTKDFRAISRRAAKNSAQGGDL